MSESVQARFAQALQRRLRHAPPAVQRVLEPRVQRALAEATVAPAPSPGPERAARIVSPLARLNLDIAATQLGTDLNSAQRFRASWSRICAEDDVAQAVQRGPENAGPLNSHRLVLRTLALMRDLSPDYLRHFMSHTDTLLWLEQAHVKPREAAGKTKPVKTGRVRK